MFKVLMISAFGTEFLDNVLCHLGFLLIPRYIDESNSKCLPIFFFIKPSAVSLVKSMNFHSEYLLRKSS